MICRSYTHNTPHWRRHSHTPALHPSHTMPSQPSQPRHHPPSRPTFCKRQPHLLTHAITSDHRSTLSPHRIILRLSRILRLPLAPHSNNTSSLSLRKCRRSHWPPAEMNARNIVDEETNSEGTRQRRQPSLAALVYVQLAFAVA